MAKPFAIDILHQTIIVVGSRLLLPLLLPPAVEGPLIIIATFLLSDAGDEAIRRIAVLRPWFGLRSMSKERFAL